jgi:hypothetical protein
LLTC